jgi:hypothetical protein
MLIRLTFSFIDRALDLRSTPYPPGRTPTRYSADASVPRLAGFSLIT